MEENKNKKKGGTGMFTFEESFDSKAKLKVVGVGGAGGNAVNRMVEEGLDNVEFIAVNTDAQDLDRNKAHSRIQVGERITKGLGAGAKPDVGRRAMEEDKNLIMEKLEGADMVFITAGMGGGTGTGGAPIIASIAQEMDVLTVGIVTRPFLFEGPQRSRNAEAGIDDMRKFVDTIIVIPNQRLLSMIERNTPMMEAFKRADDILYHATRGISDLINVNGLINIDFADAVTVMKDMGDALMGTGYSSGENMAREAAEMAVNSPLLDDISITGAKGVLINITGGEDMPLHDVSEVSNFIYETIGEDVNTNIIVGAVTDPNMQGQLRVTVIATGFNKETMESHLSAQEAEKIAERVNYVSKRIEKKEFKRAPESRKENVKAKETRELPLFRNVAKKPEPEKAPEPEKVAEQEKTVEPKKEPSAEPKEEEIEKLITDVENWMDIVKEDEKPKAETSSQAKNDEALYQEAKQEIEDESMQEQKKDGKIQRFNSVKDLISPEEFKNSINREAIKNVGEKLCKSVKKDKFGVKDGLLIHPEHDDLEVPTFLRQQMD